MNKAARPKPCRIVVVDDEGCPVPGAILTVEARDHVLPEMPLLADGDAEVRLRLPAGHYSLSAHAGGASARRSLDIGGSSPSPHVELVLSDRKSEPC